MVSPSSWSGVGTLKTRVAGVQHCPEWPGLLSIWVLLGGGQFPGQRGLFVQKGVAPSQPDIAEASSQNANGRKVSGAPSP